MATGPTATLTPGVRGRERLGGGTVGLGGSGSLLEHYYLLQDLSPRDEERTVARTFLALDRDRRVEVALVLPQAGGEGREEHFERQLERVLQLEHPHLPRLVGGGKIGLRYHLASEFVTGTDLRGMLGAGRLPHHVALYLLRKLTETVTFLHTSGFCHGDLHPENVLLDELGQLKLVGFLPAPFGEPLTTRPPEASVRRYASPEALREGRHHPPGDVYSLGLIAYELFTGRPLLPRGSVERTLRNQIEVQKALERVARVTRSVPIELSNVLRAMIQVDPEQRPRFGLELLGAMESAMPTPPGEDELAEELAELLAGPRQRASKLLLKDAATHLEAREPLPASACLQRAAHLPGALDEADRRIAEELVRRVLWRAFPASDSGLDAETERGYLEALLLQAYRAADAMGQEELRTLAAFRLAQNEAHEASEASPGPLAHLYPSPEEIDALQTLKPRLVRRLLADTAESGELLTLAALTEGFRPRLEEGISAIRTDLVKCYRSHSSPGESDPEMDLPVRLPAAARVLPGSLEAVTAPPPHRPHHQDVEERIIEVPSDIETLSDVQNPSWADSSDPDGLMEIVLDAVFASQAELATGKGSNREREKEDEESAVRELDPPLVL